MAATERKLMTALDKSAKAFNTALKALAKQSEDLSEVPALVEGLVQQVMAKEAELEDLSVEVQERRRANNAELAILRREDEEELLKNLLDARDLAWIKTAEVSNMTDTLDRIGANCDDDIRREVGAAVGKAEAKHSNAIALMESDFKLQMAELKASNEQLHTMNLFMKQQVEEAQGSLVAERQARVEVEKARAESDGVTVNATQGK